MKLAKLLKKWALLEPQRCLGGQGWYSITLASGTAHIEYRNPTQEDHALLQYAVQLSVEEKGWLWSIFYSANGDYHAGVTMPERYMNQTGRFPALAMLAAYLSALELAQP